MLQVNDAYEQLHCAGDQSSRAARDKWVARMRTPGEQREQVEDSVWHFSQRGEKDEAAFAAQLEKMREQGRWDDEREGSVRLGADAGG